jgi:hypothetical protein
MNRFYVIVIIIIAAAGLMLPAFYNGYPLAYSDMLMPDFFTGLSLILLVILLLFPPKNIWVLVATIWSYWFFTSTHLTHAPAHLFLLIALIILKWLMPKFWMGLSWKSLKVNLVLVLMNFIFLPTLHYLYKGGFISSKAGQVFLLARNIENGSVQTYLNDACGHTNYRMCLYKDSLPKSAPEFLWDPNSVLVKIGGWEENKLEIEAINHHIFFEPKYLAFRF